MSLLTRLALGLAAFALVLLILAPLVGIVAGTDVASLMTALQHPLVWPALTLSLLTTATSLALILLFGTPLAWLLSQRSGPGWRALEALMHMPVVLPPAVAGLGLLLAFGRDGWLSGVLYPRGASLSLTTAAVVLAQTFVAAPFYLQAATEAFRQLDPRLTLVAQTLGASPARRFFSVVLPVSRSALVGGAALSWARALGEFGATLIFAGSLSGRTQTLALAIYAALEADVRVAQALSLVLVAVSLAVLVVVRLQPRATAGP